MTGIECTAKLRNELGVDIPIIAVTGDALQEDKDRFISAGCNEVLTKPFTRQKLQAVLNRYLTRISESKEPTSSQQSTPTQPSDLQPRVSSSPAPYNAYIN